MAKNDKIIRPSEMPGAQQPSGWQFPPKPGYDVVDSGRGPGEIKEVGDMGDRIYAGLDDADMGCDVSHDATNRIGGFGDQTASDPHNASEFEHPRLADKPVGKPAIDTVQSVRLTGTGSDSMDDCYPDRQRSNAPMDADDK